MSIIYGDFGNKENSLTSKINVALRQVPHADDEKTEQYQFFATKTQLVTITLNCNSVSCDRSSQILSNLLKSIK